MKFDIIVGNPPYHEGTTDKSAQGTPIYDKFISIAKCCNPELISCIIPSRWFAGGMGLDSFRENMVSDRHLYSLVSYPNGKDCFPASSTGGICYFLWKKQYSGDCSFTTVRAGRSTEKKRNLSQYQFILRDNIAVDILEKVIKETSVYMSSIVESINTFNFVSKSRGTEAKEAPDDYELLSSKGFGYISKDKVKTNQNLANKYKVIVSQIISEHAAEPDKKGMYKLLSSLRVLKPRQVCTFSYLVLASFDDELSADNCAGYLATKFARFMLLQAVSSIHLTKDKFAFVPVVDFSEFWTDDKLYTKYNLNKEEIEYIEALIKPME